MAKHFSIPLARYPAQLNSRGGAVSAGFSLLEMLVVVAIIGLMISATVGVTGALNSNRGNTAIHQLTAVLDTARARALSGQGEVWVVFAVAGTASPVEPFRSYAICVSSSLESSATPEVLLPVSAWEQLPQGFVFSTIDPALSTSGRNLLTDPGALQPVRISATDSATVACPALGFGALGQIVFPPTAPTPLLLSIAEGDASGGGSQAPGGQAHTPEQCRWLAMQRNTGKAIILP